MSPSMRHLVPLFFAGMLLAPAHGLPEASDVPPALVGGGLKVVAALAATRAGAHAGWAGLAALLLAGARVADARDAFGP